LVVYADVLIVLNLFVNFFILRLTCRFCKENRGFLRIILAAFIGAIFSLYIFLPSAGMIIETVFRFAVSSLIVLLAFGFDSLKSMIRRVAVFFVTSFLYAGVMMGIWSIFKPDNLAINNGVVYVGISPPILIIATLVSYCLLTIMRFFSQKQAYCGKRCKLKITCNDKSVVLNALVDTGHSLTDVLTNRDVIIIERKTAMRLVDILPTATDINTAHLPHGFRLIPYSVVGGHGLLTAFVPDRVELLEGDEVREIHSTLLGISDEPLGEDYKGIINPMVLAK